MRPEDIRQFLHQRPFQPFRVTLTDGWPGEDRRIADVITVLGASP